MTSKLRPLENRKIGSKLPPLNLANASTFKPAKPISQMIFEKYDDDQSGSISLEELQLLCYDYGFYLTDEDAAQLSISLDKNEDKQISYDEFIEFWKSNEKFKSLGMENSELLTRKKIVEVFLDEDKNHSGTIDINEFLHFYMQLKQVIPQIAGFKRKELWEAVDTNKNGEIEFNELVQYFMKIGVICSFFK